MQPGLSKHQASSRGAVMVKVRVRREAASSQKCASSALATEATVAAMLQLIEPEISALDTTGSASNRRASTRAFWAQLAVSLTADSYLTRRAVSVDAPVLAATSFCE